MKMRKKKKTETTIMVQHSQQVEMAYLKEDALYVEIRGTKVISVHSETMKILKTDKIYRICQIQIILQIQIVTPTQTQIL